MESNISQLPNDMLIEIFLNLSLRDLFRICKTNRQFYHLCLDDRLWKLKLLRDFPELPLLDRLPEQQNYGELYVYRYWILNGRAKIFRITPQDIPKYTNFDNIDKILLKLNNADSLINRLIKDGLKDGDIVYLVSKNSIMQQFIYNGYRFIFLKKEIGSIYIPSQFKVIGLGAPLRGEDLPIRYWLKMNQDFNVYVSFNPEPYDAQIIENFKPIKVDDSPTNDDRITSIFQKGSGYKFHETWFIASNDITYFILIAYRFFRRTNILTTLLRKQYFLYLTEDLYTLPNLQFDLSKYHPDRTIFVVYDKLLFIPSLS